MLTIIAITNTGTTTPATIVPADDKESKMKLIKIFKIYF
jgi:hypothetical protein